MLSRGSTEPLNVDNSGTYELGSYEVLWGKVLLKVNLGTGYSAWLLFIKDNNLDPAPSN